jgi:hypothetical protein
MFLRSSTPVEDDIDAGARGNVFEGDRSRRGVRPKSGRNSEQECAGAETAQIVF